MTTTMIDKTYTYAVIGASNNEEKFGYKVAYYLQHNGYTMVPVHPKEEIILDTLVYKTLEDVRTEVDVVIFVVPPNVTEQVLETVYAEGITKVWFQPGSESDLAIQFCKLNNIAYVAGACIMTSQ
ncbi:CoA-binding protein [Candidatus Woesearchaeota archaeon]|nr:CoA-binding protein [Candidatus Woesearchaeota archaeon]